MLRRTRAARPARPGRARTRSRSPDAHRGPRSAPTASPSSPPLRLHPSVTERSPLLKESGLRAQGTNRGAEEPPRQAFHGLLRADALPTISPRRRQHPLTLALVLARERLEATLEQLVAPRVVERVRDL